jgi:hypothetical protein
MCNGLRYECTWVWEVLDDQLRVNGFGDGHRGPTGPGSSCAATGTLDDMDHAPHPRLASTPKASPSLGQPQLPSEHITVTVPLDSSASHPLHITFTATLTSTAGLDAIDAIHRTSQWADRPALDGLQRAFDRAHPAVQVLHHVVRVEIPDVGEMVRAGLAGDGASNGSQVGGLEGAENGVYAPWRGETAFLGKLRIGLDRDAGVVGRRGDEDEEGNSDEEDAM